MNYENSKDVRSDLANLTIEPPLYRVVVHNDDFTPMEFVMGILERFFYMSRSTAFDIMMEAHTKGRAVCGIFPRDAAETRISQIIDYARLHEHPLSCSMEVA